MLTLKTVSAPRIVDCMTNHRKWNERLGEQLPCTCETLERVFGFTRSECGHVCEKFKELPFCNMSVKSRVMPTKDYLQKLFDKHLSAFYFRNKDKFRVPLAVLIDNSRRWTEEFGNFLIFSNQCGYPNQVKYQNLKERWDDYLVITRFIDKEQVSNSVSCPALYQQRAAKCWKNNPAYTILSEADYLARRQKLFDQIIKLKISGLSRSPCKSFHSHKYGLTSIANKKSSFLASGFSSDTLKDRPLLSYFHHCGNPVFSAFARAGLFLFHFLAPESISVISNHAVTKKLNLFNIDLFNEKRKIFLKAGKMDIDNFFPSIPHDLIEKGWKWLMSKWQQTNRR